MRADPFSSNTLTASLDQLQARQQQYTSQLSSGLAISAPSDNPLTAAQSVAIGSAIQRDDAYVQAEASLASRLQVQDSALGSAVSQVTSAISLAVEGLGGTLDAAQLQTLGTQLGGLRDEVLSLANTAYNGTYLFAGTAGTTQPFTLDSSGSPATAVYHGDGNDSSVQTAQGQRVTVSLPGSQVFQSGSGDVLGALDRLVADFSSGTLSTSAQDDLVALRNGLSALSNARSLLGGGLRTLQSASTYTQTQETELKAAQTTLVSADTATVATELSTTETQQQALISAITAAESSKLNLFDYIQ